MDPLYANYDKRKNSQENSTPTPTPSASMPVFGMPMNSTPSPIAPGPIVSGSTSSTPASVSSAPAATSALAPIAPTPVISSEPAAPIRPVAPSNFEPATPIRPVAPSNFEPAKPIVSADPVSIQPNPFASQQQIPFSGKGDIVLNMNQPKQSKKGLFIALAGLAIAAVVALVVMVVMPGTKNNSAEAQNISNLIRYMYTGDINGEKNPDKVYAHNLVTSEEKTIFVDTARVLFETFVNSLNNDGRESLSSTIENYTATLNAVKIIWANDVNDFTEQDLKNMAAQSDDKNLASIDAKYDSLEEEGIAILNSYVGAKKNMINNKLTLYKMYIANGCKGLDESCIRQFNSDREILTQKNNTNKAVNEVSSTRARIVNDLYMYCGEIYSSIVGENF